MAVLSIVIPAYNEEEAIAGVVERCLNLREELKATLGLDDVEIIVIDDGSRDRTAQIVLGYPDVRLVSFAQNRGYGAALKAGFAEAKGNILGFLDGDGTCDPKCFVELCHELKRRGCDVVLGSRMHRGSKMPWVRRIGNLLWAGLISFISGRRIVDPATGMRIFQRRVLDRLYPLPDGLHFSPAMTCKAVLSNGLTIAEVPMAYAERSGRSKLSVIRDGLRFLNTILELSLLYKPRKVMGSVGAGLLVLSGIYAFYPIEYYLRHARLEEWMIYRLLSIMVFVAVGLNIIAIGEMAESFLAAFGWRARGETLTDYVIRKVFSPRKLAGAGCALIVAALVLNLKGAYQYLTLHHVLVHWSYVVVGGTLILAGFQLLGLAVLRKFVEMLGDSLQGPRASPER